MNSPARRIVFMAAFAGLAGLGAAPGERVLFEVDLTRGSAGTGTVTGGKWADGWKTTGAKGERIVFDAGRPVANGRLDVTFTADELPWQSQ